MRGFTLIETMVAITILTLAMAGPLFTASRAILATQTARDQLAALYLAQEGIEYVRMMRDNQYLAAYQANSTNIAEIAWNTFLTAPLDQFSIAKCIAPALCTLDSAALDPLGFGVSQPCANNTCASEPLYLTSCAEGSSCALPVVYTQQSDLVGSVQTPFTRTIQAIPIAPNEEKIVSTVSWTSHGTPYSVTVSDHLTSWQ